MFFGPCRTLQWACYFHFLSLPRRYPPQFVGRLLGYGNLVVALVGDVPLSALNGFVVYSDMLGSTQARYLLVHFLLQLMPSSATCPCRGFCTGNIRRREAWRRELWAAVEEGKSRGGRTVPSAADELEEVEEDEEDEEEVTPQAAKRPVIDDGVEMSQIGAANGGLTSPDRYGPVRGVQQPPARVPTIEPPKPTSPKAWRSKPLAFDMD